MGGFLCLSRREGQRLHLLLPDQREITIAVMEMDSYGKKVRLGVQAPSDVLVAREEVREQWGLPPRPGAAAEEGMRFHDLPRALRCWRLVVQHGSVQVCVEAREVARVPDASAFDYWCRELISAGATPEELALRCTAWGVEACVRCDGREIHAG